jgi:hypothetical protein
MANGELCKTCGCQESEHEIALEALNPANSSNAWVCFPSYRVTRKWTRQQICDFFVKNGVEEGWIYEYFYDVIRCSGFSTTRKRDKKFVSLQK